jgi:hypothetical protein
MANDTRRRLGELVVVKNTGRRLNSADVYHAMHVRMGRDLVALMLTDREVDEAMRRAKRNPEDMPVYRPRFIDRFRRKW